MLGRESLLVEQHDTVGGWCRSIEDKGFTFDHAGHIMFSTDPYVLALYERLLGDNLHWQDREAWIYSKSVYTRYPFQSALHGLPPEVLKECLVGAIEARFGSLEKPTLRVSPTGRRGPPRRHRDGRLRPRTGPTPGPGPRHGAAQLRGVHLQGLGQGRGAAFRHSVQPEALGGAAERDGNLVAGRARAAARPGGDDRRRAAAGAKAHRSQRALRLSAARRLPGVDERLPAAARRPLALGTRVVAVSPSRKTVTFDDGRSVGFQTLISTMPLPHLVEAMGAEAPAFVREAARQLRHVSVRCVNLGVGRENITDKHWIYYPEDTVFHRIFVQGNASPHCNAPGGFGLTCEITYSPLTKPLPAEGDALVRRCIDDCGARGPAAPRRCHRVRQPGRHALRLRGVRPCARGPRGDHSHLAREAGILLAGRYSEWAYYNSDHAFVAGRKAARGRAAAERRAPLPPTCRWPPERRTSAAPGAAPLPGRPMARSSGATCAAAGGVRGTARAHRGGGRLLGGRAVRHEAHRRHHGRQRPHLARGVELAGRCSSCSSRRKAPSGA
jgi:UDP-galactopyranose mutase